MEPSWQVMKLTDPLQTEPPDALGSELARK
jgi:hypothetical protein